MKLPNLSFCFFQCLPTDGIPNDGIPIEEVVTVAVPLTVVYVILATAGLLFTVVCLVFNFAFRERR